MFILLEAINKRGAVWINSDHVTHIAQSGAAPSNETLIHMAGGQSLAVMGPADQIAAKFTKK